MYKVTKWHRMPEGHCPQYIPIERKKYRVCRDCNTGGLLWYKRNGNWRLVDNKGNIHLC